ncbi:MAG: polyprenyl synthetase family protein [Dethiobacteria bacterium]
MKFDELLETRKTLIDSALNYYLPAEDQYPEGIHRAMRYSVFAGGKRLRPLLVLFTMELFTADWKNALPVACALEFMHTYSLIHDDLPAMDDDDYRRGQPTSHKVFGEAVAILAGDALLTLAFEVLAVDRQKKNAFCNYYQLETSPEIKLKIIGEIATSAGVQGMVGGQAVDLDSEGKSVDLETLQYIDTHKTGKLLTASVRAGALLGGATAAELAGLTAYARLLGRGFQIVDDLLDVEGDTEKMGKICGQDAQRGKANYVSYYGLAAAKNKRDQLYEQAVGELSIFGEKSFSLKKITRRAFYRDY